MRQFNGCCDGGPYNGQQLASDRPWYRVFRQQPPQLDISEVEVSPADFSYGEYRHDLDKWVWCGWN